MASESQPVARYEVPDKPVVAILTIEDEERQFRGNRQNFADLIRTGTQMGFLTYVVTVKHLKMNSPDILGFTFRPDQNLWVQDRFPRPDVIYNRIPLREDERLPHVRRKLAFLSKHPGVRLFNRRFFNKWALYQWLHQNPVTRRHIPDTRMLGNPPSLARLLKRHRRLYLKPVRGKAGVGIMTVMLQTKESLPYRLQIQEEKGSRIYQFGGLRSLWNRISHYSAETGEGYIVQQGIPLATADDRPFDLRALAQKSITGKWELTGIGARVAGSSSITTHVPRGGYIAEPEKLLTMVFGKQEAAKVLDTVRRTILILARQIEKKSGSRMGEMSMDLGVDRSGNVWFFEANSKPMKFDEPHIRKQSLQRIFQYSLYLHRRMRQTEGV